MRIESVLAERVATAHQLLFDEPSANWLPRSAPGQLAFQAAIIPSEIDSIRFDLIDLAISLF